MSDNDAQNKKIDIHIPGDNNTFVGSAGTVSISGTTNVVLLGEELVEKEMIQFGKIQISVADARLLEEFRRDYASIMEYCINTDPTVDLVDINLNDKVSILYNDKWRFKSRDFSNRELRKLKNRILKTLNELMHYISPEFLRLHEYSGHLIYRNQSWEEGCKLRDDFQPNSYRIRQEIANLYTELYPEEFEDE